MACLPCWKMNTVYLLDARQAYMSSHNLVKLKLGEFELLGYSIAGDESVVAVPSLDVCFDIGKAPDQLLTVNNVLVSHSHMDHVAGIAYYFSQRDFREMAPGRALVAAPLAPMLEELLDFWGRFDGTRPPAKIVPIHPGQEFELRRNLFAYTFATNHTRTSLGYTIVDRRQKLKPEYGDLPGPKIAELRQNGEEVTYTLNVPLVTYLGDTGSGDFQHLPCVRQSKILITECTFFEEEHTGRAAAGRHFHWDDLAQWLEEVECEHIVLTHLSRRTHIGQARQMVRRKLSRETVEKITILMDRYAPARVTSESDQNDTIDA